MLDQEEAVGTTGMSTGDGDMLTLSTGVVLKLRTPSEMVVDSAFRAVEKHKPKPPRMYLEDKEREEENPSDPDYLAELRQWKLEVGMRGLRALIPSGTTLESVPEGLPGPDDPDYIDLMASMTIDPGAGRFTRYVQWVLHIACKGVDDVQNLTNALQRLIGVSEEDVAKAQAMFQGDEGETADTGTPT